MSYAVCVCVSFGAVRARTDTQHIQSDTFCIFLTARRCCYSHESFGRDYKIAKKNESTGVNKKNLLCINVVGVFFPLNLSLYPFRSVFICVVLLSSHCFRLASCFFFVHLSNISIIWYEIRELINKYSLLVPIYIKCKQRTHINIHSHHQWLLLPLLQHQQHINKTDASKQNSQPKPNIHRINFNIPIQNNKSKNSIASINLPY